MILVMFDIDGTLTESYEYDEKLYEKAVKEMLGINNFSTNWKDYKYVTDSGILNEIIEKKFGRKMTDEELKKVREAFVRYVKELYSEDKSQFREIKGASSMIEKLKERDDIAIAVATGGWEESARFKLEKSGFDLNGIPFASSKDSFDRVKIMDIAKRKALEFYNVDSFERIIYVGDGLWDVKASKESGFDFIGVGKKLADMGLDKHIYDYSNGLFEEFI